MISKEAKDNLEGVLYDWAMDNLDLPHPELFSRQAAATIIGELLEAGHEEE